MTEQYAELRSRLVVGRKSDGRGVYDEAAKKELIVACLKRKQSINHALARGVGTDAQADYAAPSSMFQGSSAS